MLSHVQLFVTPMDCSTPGLPVHHQLSGFIQTHLHQVGDIILPSQPLLSPSPTSSVSQHQGLFQWVSSLHQVAKISKFQFQHQSFQWTARTYLLQDGLVGSPCSPRDSQLSFPTPQFKSIDSSVFSFLYSPTLTSIHKYWKNHSSTRQTFVGKVMSLLFNMLFRLVITFPPRSKCILISWLQSPSASKKWSLPLFPLFICPFILFIYLLPIYLPWSDGTEWHDLNCLKVEF